MLIAKCCKQGKVNQVIGKVDRLSVKFSPRSQAFAGRCFAASC